MGEYVAQRRLWYRLQFDLFEDDGSGRVGELYGSLSTEVLGSVGAGNSDGGRGNETVGGVAVD